MFESGDKYSEMLGTSPTQDLEKVRGRLAKHIISGRASILVSPSTMAAHHPQPYGEILLGTF